MPKLAPYLAFEGGQATEAMRFYEKPLGGRIEMTLTYGESPMVEPFAAEHRHLVVHSALKLSGGGPSGFSDIGLTLEYDDDAAGEAAFDALASSGSVSMPMPPSFWVNRFGMLTDRYGVGRRVNAGPSTI